MPEAPPPAGRTGSMVHLGPVTFSRTGSAIRSTVDVDLAGRTERWWLETATVWAGVVDASHAPFVPLATLLAAAAGEDLTVDGALDPVQLDGLGRATAMYERWWGLRPPAVDPASVGGTSRSAGVRGLLFSRGIDSSAELAGAVLGASAPFGLAITVLGVDALQSADVSAAGARRSAAVAGRFDLPHAVVVTNLRAIADAHLRWDRTHGCVVAGAGLFLGGAIDELVLAQAVSGATERVRNRPYGVHRELIGNWSTTSTRVVSGDAELDRVDKVARVLQVPGLRSDVHLCWEGGGSGNCGRCEKCCGTATALWILGHGEVVDEWFATPLQPSVIRRLPSDDPTRPGALTEVLDRLHDAVVRDGDPWLAELDAAWSERGARVAGGARLGLAGFDPAERLRRSGDAPSGPPVVVTGALGWGEGATPLHLDEDGRDGLLARGRGADRPVPWCQVQSLSPAAARVAGSLADVWRGGVVALVEVSSPTVPASAVREMLESAAVRCWASDEPYLEAVPLIEALEAGCVPLQVALDAVTVRRGLPEWAHVLVADVLELAESTPDEDRLDAAWRAATALVAAGTLRRDVALGSPGWAAGW